MQESAQYLAGEQLPDTLVSGILAKSSVEGTDVLGVINLTPYDGWLEKTCKRGISGMKFKSLSLSKNIGISQYVEKSLGLELLQDCHGIPSESINSIKLVDPANICLLRLIINYY